MPMVRTVGEKHHRAKVPDAVVVTLRDLHEREVEPLGWRRLAHLFEINPETIKAIIYYRRRNPSYAEDR